MISLIPDTSHDQQLRIKRFLMGFISYIIFIFLVILCQRLGIVQLSISKTILISTAALLINLIFYLIFIFELNLKFKDKSLTMIQMSVAMLIVMITIYFINEVRGAFLLLYVVSFSFGMFRLKTKQFLVLTLLILFSYLTIIALMYKFSPMRLNIRVEIIRLIVLSFVFTWLSFLGGYTNRLQKKIEEMATRDELTKLMNRRQLFKTLEREVNLAGRSRKPFCILMIDIDNFKKINDSYGHQAGDHVLKSVASKLSSNLRQHDYIGRYGGEEFLLILSYPTLANALICSERLRSLVDRLDPKYNGEDIKVSISIGATIYSPDENIETTLSRADKALYRAKQKGKNRTEYEGFI